MSCGCNCNSQAQTNNRHTHHYSNFALPQKLKSSDIIQGLHKCDSSTSGWASVSATSTTWDGSEPSPDR